MKNSIKIFLFCVIFAHQTTEARDPDWFQRRSSDLEDALKAQIDSERIPLLANFMGMARGKMDDEQSVLFYRAQAALLATPGHAKYFTNLLEQKKQDMLADKASYHDYTEAQEALAVLAYLQSPETVAVLGELVGDPVGRDGKLLGGGAVWDGDGWFPVNCQIALSCFEALPIENGPKLTKDDFGATNFSGVDKWKEWWEEVKAGKRTYRFKGSPIEYGPDGPVSAKELERREHDRQPGSSIVGTSGSKKKMEDTPATLDGRWRWASWLGAAVASILLLIATWRAFLRPARGL